MKNSLELDYPKEKLNIVWVTDGSDDGTQNLLEGYPNTTVHHLDARNGKIGAMNRGMEFVKTPIVIFSDANTNLGKESIRRIVNLFGNEKVGCVSGEKRIINKESDVASGAGEGDGAIGGVDAVVVAGAAVGLRVGTEACDGSPVATGAKVGTVVEFGEGSAPIEGFAVGS